MGVPAFYRWLVGRYPKAVEQAIDEGPDSDCNNPNPNGEFHNLYLDMNGIIHPCFHPDDELFGPTTFDEVFVAIFEYIDRLFRIVRPRKLVFVAVDGVAPRAKMNQQRARRYSTAKDVELAGIEEERLRREFESQGKELLPKQEFSELFDSNVITPGTVFMQKLSIALEYYIRLKLNRDPSWKSIMVILSDANVPGEGEHKIMSFIRMQRSLPGYDSSTRHCLHGLDADLIMLALATHEIHFSVLREEVLKQSPEIDISIFIANSSQKENEIFKSSEWFKQAQASNNKKAHKKPYQFLNICILREYLELDMKPESESVADIERIVDDFVFICFFIGNDFLPRLPSIEIHECGIDLLVTVYKKVFKSMGGYLVDTSNIMEENADAYINLQRVKKFMFEVGSYEDKIFIKRYTLRQKKLQRLSQERKNEENDRTNLCNSEFNTLQGDNCRIGASEFILDSFSGKCNFSSSTVKASGSIQSDALSNTKELKRMLRQFLRDKTDLFKNEVVDYDKVKLGCPGWKARYYKEKLSAENSKELEAIRIVLVDKYVEGLCWVLKYYYSGVCSWSWYFPFYYGPFASDLKYLSCAKVSFTVGRPFEPFDQLMAVLPPKSSHALPKAYRSLMNDGDSPIHNFYPLDFVVDNDGKRFTWQGVCKLPFIEETPLLGATRILRKELQKDEEARNLINNAKAFVMDSNLVCTQVSPHPQVSDGYCKQAKKHEVIGPSCGLHCFLTFYEGGSDSSNFPSPVLGKEDITHDISRCAEFVSMEPQKYIPRLLSSVNIPEKTIEHSDIVKTMLWHEYPGPHPPYSIQPQRWVPQTTPPPPNEPWKVAGHGWGSAGRGKLVVDASRLAPGAERRPSPIFSPPKMNWKVKGDINASSNYGRSQCSAAPSVSTSTAYNKFQTTDRSDNFTQIPAPNVGRSGQYSAAFSDSSSTSYNKFQALTDRSDGLSRIPAPMVDNWGRGRGNTSTNYGGNHYGAHRSGSFGQIPAPVVDNWGRGRGNTSTNYGGSQPAPAANWGRGRGTQPLSSYGSEGRGGHQNATWVPRKSDHMPSDDWRGRR